MILRSGHYRTPPLPGDPHLRVDQHLTVVWSAAAAHDHTFE
jgi:hypothetical protein